MQPRDEFEPETDSCLLALIHWQEENPDSSTLRDSGATDQNGFAMHPNAGQD